MEAIDLIAKPFFFEFVAQHASADPARLVLEAHRYPHVPVREAAAQVAARQKAKAKLPSWHAQPEVLFPPSLAMEQCSSEASARFKAQLLAGQSLVDLTGGLGVDSWAFAQRFGQVAYIERQAGLCALARHNFPRLGVGHVAVHQAEAGKYLEHCAPADAVYLDPARRNLAGQKVARLADCEPDLAALWPQLAQKTAQVLVKTAPLLDLAAGLAELAVFAPGWAREVLVVAVDGEVKEVLYWLARPPGPAEPLVRAVNLAQGTVTEFAFARSAESAAAAPLGQPDSFIYEPNAAVLKAGAFKLVAQRFGLAKLHPHTHLYTGPQLVAGFPGRAFRLLGVAKPDRKALAAWVPGGQAHLATRNFPLSVAQLRRQLDLRDGGEVYLFATTLLDQRKVVLVGQKVDGLPPEP
jgi:hypothetical protein